MHIRAVGIGPMGAELARQLSRELPGITCHEVTLISRDEKPEQWEALKNGLKGTDLLFILTGYDDPYCEAAACELGLAAREARIEITLAVVPDSSAESTQQLIDLSKTVDAVVITSVDFLGIQPKPQTTYAMRHLVIMLTELMHQSWVFGKDFQDLATIMRGGNFGKLGVGMANTYDGLSAGMAAVQQLAVQGMMLDAATWMLVVLHDPGDFLSRLSRDGVLKTIQDHAGENPDIFIGTIEDEALDKNSTCVSVLAVSKDLPATRA